MYLSKYLVVLFAIMLSLSADAQPYPETETAISKAALRAVGHQLLLESGDSTSRVLPITELGGVYKITFEKEFSFNPDWLVSIFDKVVKTTELPNSYLVEVKKCGTDTVMYSYSVNKNKFSDAIVSCSGRLQPQGCYVLYFTSLASNEAIVQTESSTSNTKKPSYLIFYVLVSVLLVFLFFIFWRKYAHRKTDAEVLPQNYLSIGIYLFNHASMKLKLPESETELSGKEADLLLLLHTSVNKTLARDYILQEVWGDEGAYVGRTLDVFISKLRKKLELDKNVKIINVRGVGYKLLVESE